MKNSPWKFVLIGFGGAAALFLIAAVLYANSIGMSNLKRMYVLETTDRQIVEMGADERGIPQYLAKLNRQEELLKERMSREGWTFAEQEGSGYFFEKDGRKAIVTSRIWNHRYVIFKVSGDTVDLALSESSDAG
ncbi:hypothetical protein J19TS2_39930 [Cohnella xylanilytica]|uniref:hypothetical protein n=1 Tax=Cohnella xylanilytica TaxID=557555 RepID=UPI001B23824D|nr:hypothetical protein [Cohnella xylanilytica]GIO14438.1 hypothetical protein J19TS2_39930 [Cohnella xylanilytica]